MARRIPRFGRVALMAFPALASPVAALAQAPVAVVEEVGPGVPGLEFMDYLHQGQTVRLPAGATIVVSYLRSCTRERIVGGEIVIGAEQSEITGGSVERSTADCDAGKMTLDAHQGDVAAGFVNRDTSQGRKLEPMPRPRLTLHGASPIFALDGGGAVVIERLGASDERQVVEIAAGSHGFFDFARAGKSLTPGAFYRLTVGKQSVVIRIAANAEPGATPAVGRLVNFDPAP